MKTLNAIILTVLIGTLSINVKGQAIKEVKIGTQIWMAENLNVDRFRNGELIPYAKNNEEWVRASRQGKPAWCYYADDPANGQKYGKLYNWFAVIDPRGLGPKGWHVPNNSEWSTLISFLGGTGVAGEKLKSTSGWEQNGNGTNESGFSALPGGSRDWNGGCSYIGTNGFWWSSSVNSDISAWVRYMSFKPTVFSGSYNKDDGCSVRCVKNN